MNGENLCAAPFGNVTAQTNSSFENICSFFGVAMAMPVYLNMYAVYIGNDDSKNAA